MSLKKKRWVGKRIFIQGESSDDPSLLASVLAGDAQEAQQLLLLATLGQDGDAIEYGLSAGREDEYDDEVIVAPLRPRNWALTKRQVWSGEESGEASLPRNPSLNLNREQEVKLRGLLKDFDGIAYRVFVFDDDTSAYVIPKKRPFHAFIDACLALGYPIMGIDQINITTWTKPMLLEAMEAYEHVLAQAESVEPVPA